MAGNRTQAPQNVSQAANQLRGLGSIPSHGSLLFAFISMCYYMIYFIIIIIIPITIISDPRRGCFMGFREFIFFFFFLFFSFFFFFFCHDLVRGISLEPSLVETPDSVCCLVLQSNFTLLLTIQFASLFFFSFFFSAKILSGPYLWNRYSQRLQIECAAWSLWSNFALLLTIQFALLFFFSGTILPQFCPGHISGTVTRRDSKLSVLLGPAV